MVTSPEPVVRSRFTGARYGERAVKVSFYPRVQQDGEKQQREQYGCKMLFG